MHKISNCSSEVWKYFLKNRLTEKASEIISAGPIHILCANHGFHLVIMDVAYKIVAKNEEENMEEENSENNTTDSTQPLKHFKESYLFFFFCCCLLLSNGKIPQPQLITALEKN